MTKTYRGLTWLAVLTAVVFCAVWLWDRWCVFPSNYWNDLRLAPALAFHRGFRVYGVGDGIANTWMYGPLPLMLMWPVTWAETAAGVLKIGGAMTIGFTALTVAAVAWAWPGRSDPAARSTAALLSVLLSVAPFFMADVFAIGLGLLSNLFLVQRRGWASAVCAMGAVACKQLAVGVLLAQLIWLAVTNRREIKPHLIRYAVVLGLLGGVLAWLIGPAELWHTMVVMPGRLPWTDDWAQRVSDSASFFVLYVAVPIAGMAIARGFFWRRDSAVLLPAITFFAVLPLGLAALFKTGGNLNSMYCFALWLPPVASAVFGALGARALLAGSLLVAGLGVYRLTNHPPTLVPELQAYREAAYLTTRAAERCWFPTNPLVTLCGENRYYHDEDGMRIRELAGLSLSEDQIRAGLPRRQRVTVFPHIWMQYSFWGIAEKRLSRTTVIRPFGRWWVAGDLPRLLEPEAELLPAKP